MRFRHLIFFTILFFGIQVALPQELPPADFEVHFPVSSAKIDPSFDNNEKVINDILDFINHINGSDSLHISNVQFYGNASPDGSYQINYRLAEQRRNALESLILEKVYIPDTLITRDDSYIAWKRLEEWVRQSNLPQKTTVLNILNEPARLVPLAGNRTIDARIPKLIRLDGGKVWQILKKEYFPDMRIAGMVINSFRYTPMPVPEPVPTPEPQPDSVIEVTEVVDSVIPQKIQEDKSGFMHHFTIKTNAIGWVMAIANIGIELDVCKHLSFNMPIYYCGINNFTERLKFRTFAIQPELRIWSSSENDGFFIGGHFGMAYYNTALNGRYRFQDHDGNSPALGGGIALGYRLPISHNRRWKVEFSAGAGVYSLNYDKFINEENGPLIGSREKTFIGIDQISVAFSYSFNLKKGNAK